MSSPAYLAQCMWRIPVLITSDPFRPSLPRHGAYDFLLYVSPSFTYIRYISQNDFPSPSSDEGGSTCFVVHLSFSSAQLIGPAPLVLPSALFNISRLLGK